MLWGGLRPIISQLLVDFWTLLGCGYVAVATPSRTMLIFLAALSAFSVTFSGGSLTNRWTVSLPMAPLIVLQALRYVLFYLTQKKAEKQTKCGRFLSFTIGSLSLLLVATSGLLSVLFPAVELPLNFPSEYRVGVVDVYLPADIHYITSVQDLHEPVREKKVDHVTARIFYPTNDENVESVPLLKPHTSKDFCEQSMKMAAPDPLKPFSWILHTWRLSKVPATRHAQPLKDKKTPIIVFSHGLGGSADIYTFQTMALAAKGYTVVIVEHADGSAPVITRKDGSKLLSDRSVSVDWREGRFQRYRRSRRAMVEFRAEEFLAAVDAMTALNENNLPELESMGLSFVGKLDTNEIHYMGHSFGGATSLHASSIRPPSSVVAHEPVSGWLPDQTRFSLYDAKRMEGSAVNYTYYWVDDEEAKARDVLELNGPSLHDTNMLILFSTEWHSNNWEGSHLLEDMFQRGRLGPDGGIGRFKVIDGAHHMEFSDSQMLTPVWLARDGNSTGTRNPLDTAWDIHVETHNFLKDVHLHQV